jgi:FtsZ-interacting cell division protein YlmF
MQSGETPPPQAAASPARRTAVNRTVANVGSSVASLFPRSRSEARVIEKTIANDHAYVVELESLSCIDAANLLDDASLKFHV